MATCPAGHESTATDYCDTCGRRIGASSSTASPQVSPAAASPQAAPQAGETQAPALAAVGCPVCQTPRTGRFCEDCGYDFNGPPPDSQAAPSQGWTAVVTADREYFDAMQESDGPGGTIEFPVGQPPREFRLSGTQLQIGRRSAADGSGPDIDLGGPPADVGVSHRHALLIAEADGTWSLVDQGSTNGTQLNGTDLAANVRTPLHEGDRISIGRWTVLTVRRGGP